MHYITINTFTEIVCFIAALCLLFRDKDPAWRRLILYLFLVCCVELGGIYMRRVMHVGNLHLYNAFMIVECGMISYFFYGLFKKYKISKKLLIGWAIVFMCMYFTELFVNHFNSFVTISVAVMSVVFVLLSLLYYYLKLKDEQYEPLLSSPSFWWVSGVLIFYFGSTACNLFNNLLAETDPASELIYSIRYQIFAILNVMLYGSWLISFICRYRQRKLNP